MSDVEETEKGGVPPTPEVRAHLAINLEKARAAKAAKAAARKAAGEDMPPKKNGEQQPTDGPDLGRVQELIGMYPRVSVEIRHHLNNQPKLVNDNYVVETKELLAFSSHLIALEGGGLYTCRVRDPENLGEVLMKFRLNINQPVRAPARAGADPWVLPPIMPPGVDPTFVAAAPPLQLPTTHTPTPQDTPMQQPTYPPPNLPPQYRALPLDQQWAFYYQMQAAQQRPAGLEPAGQVAMQQVHQLLSEKGSLQAALAQAQARAEADRKATDDRISSLQREFERQRDDERKRADRAEAEVREAKIRADADARDARHREEMQALRALIEKQNAAAAPAIKESSPLEKSLPLLIPLILEWMRGNAAKDQAERDRSNENLKMMLASMKKEPGLEGEAMKYMIELLKSRADEKVAATESQVLMLGALSSFIKDQQGDAPPMWYPIVESIIDGLKGTAMAVVAKSTPVPGLQPGEPPPTALPGASPPIEAKGEPVPATTQQSLDEQAERQQWETFLKQDEEATKYTAMVYQSGKLPPRMYSPEWRLLIFNLHHRKIEPIKLAEILADHLEHGRTFGLLPPNFLEVFKDPKKTLEGIVTQLPIWMVDKTYAQAFLDAAIKEIGDRETERVRVAREEAEEAAGVPGPAVEAEGEVVEDDEEEADGD